MSSQDQEINITDSDITISEEEYNKPWKPLLKNFIIPLYAGVVLGTTMATFKYNNTLNVVDNLVRASVEYIVNTIYLPLVISTLPITIPIVLCSKLK